MNVAVIHHGVDTVRLPLQPWVHCRERLAREGIHVRLFEGAAIRDAFRQPHDAMLLHVWQDWWNPTRFDQYRIMPILERLAAYRAEFPETVQIAHNHADTSEHPFALLTWRPGDWVLYRTPPWDRAALRPLPPERIWSYEQVWGAPRFASEIAPRWNAGFIGTPTGPRGYRKRVAKATARVGIGICAGGGGRRWRHWVPRRWHDAAMARCRIVVCPRGWGPQSVRHWDAWRSGKPVLTDRACAGAEMIPGRRLEAGVDMLVFDEPEEIPDLVRDWTQPGRADDLAAIARNGRLAAQAYDPCQRITAFFRTAVPSG